MKRLNAVRSGMQRVRGQALVEFALVIPMFLALLLSLIVLGFYVFYQQQLNGAANDAARYAIVHSSSAQCPTASWMAPGALSPPPTSYFPCDPPPSWPLLTDAGRASIWGVDPTAVVFRACWSGYWTASGNPDAPQVNADGSPNLIQRCTITGVDPTTDPGLLPCPPGNTTTSDDTGSDNPDNQVTIFACFKWAPPFAGFVFVPSQVTMRSVVTEVIQQQQ